MNYILEYIKSFSTERVPKRVKKVYERMIPIINGENEIYYFDEKKADRVINFIENFCVQGKAPFANQPLKLLLFQKAKIQAIFGILERETKHRKFREVFDVRGRKNGKTTETAGMANYFLTAEKESGQEIYSMAGDLTQAKLVWTEAADMIQRNKDFDGLLSFRWSENKIINKQTGSFFQPLSKNVRDGLNASFAILDEVHTMSRSAYDLIKQSMATREQYLISMITTAGTVRGGLFDDLYDVAKKVADGIIEDEHMLPLLYTFDNDADETEIDNEENWVLPNPALDVIKRREFLRENVNRMKDEPNFAQTVKIKDFNIIGVRGQESWLDYDIYNNEKVYDLKSIKNKECIGAFDLSQIGDLTAFTTAYFVGDEIVEDSMYWCTKNFIDKHINSKLPFQAWIDRGLLRVSGDNKINYHDVADYVYEKAKSGINYIFIGYDRYSAGYLIDEISALGYSKNYCLKDIAQGYKTLSVPMQTLEAMLKDKKLVYQNNPITKWCLSNVILVKDRNGNYMPDKSNYDRKIDGVSVVLNTLSVYIDNAEYFNSVGKENKNDAKTLTK